MNRPIVFYSASLALGCISSLFFVNNIILGAVIAASFLLVIFFTIDKRYFIFCTAFFIIGTASFYIYFNEIDLGKEVTVRITDKGDYYSIGEYKGRKLILKGSVTKVEPGEKVIITGEVKREKDYERGIVGTYTVNKYKILKKDFIGALYEVKRNAYTKFKTVMGEKNAAMVVSLCYGDTSQLSQNQKDDFNKLGVIHAVSVSGFHLAVIYKLLELTLGLEIALVICFIYTIFTGLQASTLRAFIMIFVFKLSKKVQKDYDKLSSIAFAAIILMVIKPYYISDLGFLLSFLSTLGIVLYYDKIKKILYRLPVKIGETISVTLSAQLFSMPIAAMTLNNFSTGFILGNLILLPFYSIIVVLGNVVIVLMWSEVLFNNLCFLIKIILTSLDGANYILLRISPPIVFFSFWEGVAVAFIVLSYILVKAGYKKVKYLPIFLLMSVMIQYYSFIPEIRYMNIKGQECVILKYKRDNILFCVKKPQIDINELKQRYRVERVIENANKGYRISLSKDSFAAAAGDYKDINIELYIKGRRYIFLKDTTSKNLDNFYKYDIIRVAEIKNRAIEVYDIVFGRVYAVSYQ